jgi:two-component system chemotaxis response regulator CheB
MEQVRSSLIPKIKGLAPRRPLPRTAGLSRESRTVLRDTPASSPRPADSGPVRLAPRTSPVGGYRLLVVGSSTGGPEALTRFLGALPPLPVPVAVVQHMPALFTRQFAARLDRQIGATVTEASTGQRLEPGSVVIAPGDFHLHVSGTKTSPVVRLSQEQPENYCRPAVDVLFRSAVSTYGAQVLAVVLTGMGQDGCRGAREIVDGGGSVLAQDKASSVVWGMPGAVATAGLAQEVLPLSELASAVAQRLAVSSVGGSR